MPPVREKHNAKARKSTGGLRKKGNLKKQNRNGPGNDVDSNAEVIVQRSAQDRDLDRQQRLEQELHAQTPNWSSKKKKRLEKYIDKKLKKEERVLIFQKLAKSQDGVDSTMLQSSATLGTGKTLTHHERMQKDEDLRVRHATRGWTGKRKRRSRDLSATNVVGSSEGEDEALGELNSDTSTELISIPASRAMGDEEMNRGVANKVPVMATNGLEAVGSALRRNDDGTMSAPIIRKTSKKVTTRKWKGSRFRTLAQDDASDTSFDSSDSAYDSSSDSEGSKGMVGDEQHEKEEAENEVGGDKGTEVNGDAGTDGATGEFVCDEGNEREGQPPKQKRPSFKEWATKQLALAKGYIAEPTAAENEQLHFTEPHTKKRRRIEDAEKMRGPLGQDLELPTTQFAHHVLKNETPELTRKTHVRSTDIKRPPDIAEARLMLPIVAEEQSIMEAIMLNPVVIICGETGSGKTTQVPQFLYEAGFGRVDSDNPGMIGITQPRRVAAVSMANRVAQELALTSSQVSYQIRYDATVSSSTAIKFMTDGVLLRELATDFLLSKYSIIIVDEAHERSINTDILIGVLSRVIKLREEMWTEGKEGAKPLRLIIMSATLRVDDFSENRALFPISPPIINIAARQHPVTVHFSRRTSPDYINEAIKKASKIHARLPPGGILIFLTGQNEIIGVCRRLEEKYGRKATQQKKAQHNPRNSVPGQPKMDLQRTAINPVQADVEAEDIESDVEDQAQVNVELDEEADHDGRDDLESDVDESLDHELGIDIEETEVPMHIVPLYSLLPSEKQMEVFKAPPTDSRLVVVSTNIAETSLTIPGIKYVIDSGRAKERKYDVANGIQAFQVKWISKASAAQRAGRAGRTGPGHCYRLYSSALFENHFQQFSPPEILRAPIEGVVLQMKSMHIDAVVNFPFPTPPDKHALHRAERVLVHLGALRNPSSNLSHSGTAASQITDLGRTMALFPLPPRFSRMLAAGQQHQCLPYVIAVVSAMSVGDPFLYEEALEVDETVNHSENEDRSHLASEDVRTKEMKRMRRKAFFQAQHRHASLGDYTSDILKILSVVGAYEYHGGGTSFCTGHFVRLKAMEEIHKLRAQISNIVRMYFPEINSHFSSRLLPPSKIQIKVLKQLIAAAFIDQVAIRKDLIDPSRPGRGSQYSNSHGVAYRAIGVAEDVFIHPSSVLSDRPPPEYIVFQEIVHTARVYAKGLTIVNPIWLSSLGHPVLCTYSKPFKGSDGTLMTVPRFGPEGWELPAVKAGSVPTSRQCNS